MLQFNVVVSPSSAIQGMLEGSYNPKPDGHGRKMAVGPGDSGFIVIFEKC